MARPYGHVAYIDEAGDDEAGDHGTKLIGNKALNISPERMQLAAMGAHQAARAKDISAREVADKIMVASLIVLAAISDRPPCLRQPCAARWC